MVRMEKRKTLNGDDLIQAMQRLGFDNYIQPLQIYLNKYKKLNTTGNLNENDDDDLLINNGQQ